MPAVALCNLGCSKNQVDGSRMLEHLRLSGYEPTGDFSRADVIVVNTCAFIEAAKIEAIDKILDLARFKKTGQCTLLIVAGCFSQRYRQSAAQQFPEVDYWVGIADWPRLLSRHLKIGAHPTFVRALEEPRATQYLKIAEGCSHACSFCAIPHIRGTYKSRRKRDIIEEAQWLYDQGARECILVSQDTSYYGRDSSGSLTRLLEELLKHTEFSWIRMMYLHPSLVENDLLRLVAHERRLCKYFDIPLQHCSDAMLKAMKRRPLKNGIRALIDNIRTTVPGAAIRTSLIAGFPGETKRMFEELLSFVGDMRFDKLGVFPFSPEEGTPAFSLRPMPRPATSQRRCETIMSVQREISHSIGASRIGQSVEVIIDGPSREPEAGGFQWEARTEWDAPEVDGCVYVKGRGLKPGDMVRVLIQNANDYDLFAEKSEKRNTAHALRSLPKTAGIFESGSIH
jgi:ribosomal protein S12 methylthiotransferase